MRTSNVPEQAWCQRYQEGEQENPDKAGLLMRPEADYPMLLTLRLNTRRLSEIALGQELTHSPTVNPLLSTRASSSQ